MSVRKIWDISPLSFFINFEITQSISEKITRLIYDKSHEQPCNSWLIKFSLINTKQSHQQRQISWMITKQQVIIKQRSVYNLSNQRCGYHYMQKCDQTKNMLNAKQHVHITVFYFSLSRRSSYLHTLLYITDVQFSLSNRWYWLML